MKFYYLCFSLVVNVILSSCSLSSTEGVVNTSEATTITFTLTPNTDQFLCNTGGCQSPQEFLASLAGNLPITLNQVDIDGNIIADAAVLNDLGSNGDSLANDGILAAQHSVFETSNNVLRFSAAGTNIIKIIVGDVPNREELLTQGQSVYEDYCGLSCHGIDGLGNSVFPALMGSNIVTGDSILALISLVSDGVTDSAMSAYGQVLTDTEFAAVITYIRNAFGNNVGDMAYPSDISSFHGQDSKRDDRNNVVTSPTPKPSAEPNASTSPTPEPSTTPSPVASITPAPTAAPTPTTSLTPTPEPSATPTPTYTPSPGPTPVSFSAIYDNIIKPNCSRSGCHNFTASAGLDLSSEVAFQNIVNIPSQQLPTMDLVEPSYPALSYLYQKIIDGQNDVGGSGKVMPVTGSLTSQEIQQIENWISSGALK